jgi:hypothetical protein
MIIILIIVVVLFHDIHHPNLMGKLLRNYRKINPITNFYPINLIIKFMENMVYPNIIIYYL